MTKFNTKTKVRPDTVNRAGGQAYTEDAKLALASLLLTSFLSDQYYRSGKQAMTELVDAVGRVEPLFAAKAAIYARNEFGMRSVTHVVAGEIAHAVKGEQWTKRFYDAVMRRPDDILEVLAYYKNVYGLHPLPNSLKKGAALALEGFDAYQLAKYRGEGKDISMVDAVNLVHPKATEALTALMTGTLAPADTWETALTKAGQKAETAEQKDALKTAEWKRLLAEKKLGYFALLRNLRNIEQTKDGELIRLACEALVNENAIRKSLVLPFRYEVALKEITNRNLMIALQKAEEIALANVPKLEGKTLVAVDVSGSMHFTGVGKSSMMCSGAASLFAAALFKTNDCMVMSFDTGARYLHLNPLDSLATMRSIIEHSGGGGTDFRAMWRLMGQAYDRVIILSDMQAWVGYYTPELEARNYMRSYNCAPHIYSIDLAGYGTLQFPQPKTYALAGFSEKLFELMGKLEQDREALVHAIESVEF